MTLFATAPDGVRLAYETVGAGGDIVLVHGFGSSRAQNWRDTGWYETLTGAGYRVTALDCRGHGDSDKPHAVAGYGHDEMANDVLAVMDAAGLASAFVMGYSMGGFIALQLLVRHPERVRKLIVGGVGESYLDSPQNLRDRVADPAVRAEIAAALTAPDPATIASPTARAFRAFADQPGKDRLALAACMSAPTMNLPRAVLATARRPVLVVCGETDALTGGPDGLAAAFPDGRAVTVPRRDHMTAVGDKVYKQAVLDFLGA
ncbi:MAG TPA: alpha/beta hydrolase [Rhizomicrobium sp.]|jgi:pimeloyl-ACP methyl ester carboxylesterase|nr:alpha/beta hydrolase [Rhizomicrobium sp.]